jgi:hypothetical protein
LEGKPVFYGKLSKLESVTTEGFMIDSCAAVVDALRVLLCQQCACDLVEEYVYAKVLPLRASQAWFAIRDDEKYQAQGLKGLGVDVKEAWSKVIRSVIP